MRFVWFFTVVFGVLAVINLYAFRRVTRAFSLSHGTRRLLSVLMITSLLGMLLGRIADRIWTDAPVGVLLAVASTVQLAVLIGSVPLGVADLALLFPRLLGRFFGARSEDGTEVAPPPSGAQAPGPGPELARRALLSRVAVGSAFLISGSSSVYGALRGRYDYTIEELSLKIPGLSRALDGFVIVQLSDLHIGQFVGDAELAVAEALIEKARPDLIVLTGDLLDHDPRLAHRLGRFVRRIGPRAREGVVAISGNHDFFAGIEATVAALTAGGATVLRNRGRIIGDAQAGLALLGVDDVWAARMGRSRGPDLERAIESLPALGGRVSPARDLPRVLLCHNPVYFEKAAGKIALQLSGHTHGGQVNFLIRPADWVLGHGWVSGAYERNGSRLYVNRGFGTVGPPARIGAPPEITRVVLEA